MYVYSFLSKYMCVACPNMFFYSKHPNTVMLIEPEMKLEIIILSDNTRANKLHPALQEQCCSLFLWIIPQLGLRLFFSIISGPCAYLRTFTEVSFQSQFGTLKTFNQLRVSLSWLANISLHWSNFISAKSMFFRLEMRRLLLFYIIEGLLYQNVLVFYHSKLTGIAAVRVSQLWCSAGQLLHIISNVLEKKSSTFLNFIHFWDHLCIALRLWSSSTLHLEPILL